MAQIRGLLVVAMVKQAVCPGRMQVNALSSNVKFSCHLCNVWNTVPISDACYFQGVVKTGWEPANDADYIVNVQTL